MNELIKQEEKDSKLQYYVVMNHEEQYSIWPTYKPIPRGWKAIGEAKNKEDCLAYIEKVWTDMRPLSLRKKMEGLSLDAMQKKTKKHMVLKNLGSCQKQNKKNIKTQSNKKSSTSHKT